MKVAIVHRFKGTKTKFCVNGGEMLWNTCYSMEIIDKIPEDVRMKIREARIIETGVSLSVQNILQLLPQDQRWYVVDRDGSMFDGRVRLERMRNIMISITRTGGTGSVVSHWNNIFMMILILMMMMIPVVMSEGTVCWPQNGHLVLRLLSSAVQPAMISSS